MKSIMLMVLCGFLASFSAIASEGLVSLESPYTVKKTADRFESIILAKGLTVSYTHLTLPTTPYV